MTNRPSALGAAGPLLQGGPQLLAADAAGGAEPEFLVCIICCIVCVIELFAVLMLLFVDAMFFLCGTEPELLRLRIPRDAEVQVQAVVGRGELLQMTIVLIIMIIVLAVVIIIIIIVAQYVGAPPDARGRPARTASRRSRGARRAAAPGPRRAAPPAPPARWRRAG